MSKKQTMRTPEEKKALLAKVAELRKTVQSNGRPLNAHDACKQAGVPYATWYSWIAASKTKKVLRRKTQKNLPAIVPSVSGRGQQLDSNFIHIPLDNDAEKDENFTCVVIKGKDKTVASLAAALGALIRQ